MLRSNNLNVDIFEEMQKSSVKVRVNVTADILYCVYCRSYPQRWWRRVYIEEFYPTVYLGDTFLESMLSQHGLKVQCIWKVFRPLYFFHILLRYS